MATFNNHPTYQQAIEFASDTFDAFYDQHERITAKYAAGRGADELVRLMERDEAKLAAALCAQSELICHLFGESDAQVHDDLMALRRQKRAAE